MKTMFAKMLAILCLIVITKTTCISQIIPDIDDSVVNSCVVSDVSGKVTYKENGTEMPVKAGTVLKEGATVTIPDGGSVTLAKDEMSLVVNKKGNYQVASMIKNVKEKGKVSRFARMAYAAKGYGDTTASKKPPTGKNWGGKDSLIIFPPINGKIPLKPIKISWTSSTSKSLYKLSIFQKSLESPVFSATLSNTFFIFDPNQFAITPNNPCFVQVWLINDVESASKVTSFTFVPNEYEESVLQLLKNDSEYNESNAINKLLIEANQLDENGFKLSAAERYKMALAMDNTNILATKMYSSFLKNSNY